MRVNAARDVGYEVRARAHDGRVHIRMGFAWYTASGDEAADLGWRILAAVQEIREQEGGNGARDGH